jgi:hypothetical protein
MAKLAQQGSQQEDKLKGKELERAVVNYDHVVHVDLAHIVQKRTNIVLFELLCVGCVIDARSSLLHFRAPKDRFIVEIPATPGNELLKSLSVLSLLKKEDLPVTRENMRLDRPQFVMGVFEPEQVTKQQPAALADTRTQFIQVVENRDITITCKFLR